MRIRSSVRKAGRRGSVIVIVTWRRSRAGTAIGDQRRVRIRELYVIAAAVLVRPFPAPNVDLVVLATRILGVGSIWKTNIRNAAPGVLQCAASNSGHVYGLKYSRDFKVLPFGKSETPTKASVESNIILSVVGNDGEVNASWLSGTVRVYQCVSFPLPRGPSRRGGRRSSHYQAVAGLRSARGKWCWIFVGSTARKIVSVQLIRSIRATPVLDTHVGAVSGESYPGVWPIVGTIVVHHSYT